MVNEHTLRERQVTRAVSEVMRANDPETINRTKAIQQVLVEGQVDKSKINAKLYACESSPALKRMRSTARPSLQCLSPLY